MYVAKETANGKEEKEKRKKKKKEETRNSLLSHSEIRSDKQKLFTRVIDKHVCFFFFFIFFFFFFHFFLRPALVQTKDYSRSN